MTLLQLKYFQTLAYILHYGRAADALHIAQPSLSYSIAELEKELGAQLFDRQGRAIRLSKAGKEFLPYVEKALDLIRHGKNMIQREYKEDISHIHIGYIYSICTNFIPQVLDAIHKELVLPNIKIEYEQLLASAELNKLRHQEIDLAFTVHTADDINSVPLFYQNIYLVVSPEHPLADQQTILLTMLANEPLILFNTDSVQVMTLTRQFKAVGVNPHILLNTSQITTLLNMVKSDRVGTFLYRSIVEAHPDIVGIPVMPSIEQRIGVIWKKGKYQNATTEKVIKFIENF